MSKTPINNSFNIAANPGNQKSSAKNQTTLSNTQKMPTPKLQLNPPAPQKTINHQIMMDKAAALTRSQTQTTQQKKAIPSAKLEFSKAKSSNQLNNKTAQIKIQQQSAQKNQSIPSAKQEFAKAKISGKATHDFNSISMNKNKRSISR